VRTLSVVGLGWIDRAAMRDADALDDTVTEGKEEALGVEVEVEVAAMNAIEEEVAGVGVDDGIGTLLGLGLGTDTGVGTGAIGAARATTATLFSFFAMLFSRNTPGINPPPLPPLLLLPVGDPTEGAGVSWVSDSVITCEMVLLSAPLTIPAGSDGVFALSVYTDEALRGGGAVRTVRLGSGVTTETGGGVEETFNMDFKKEDEEGEVTAVVALG
jgi:hypothetical protein